jgi:hypothetical protein
LVHESMLTNWVGRFTVGPPDRPHT